MKVWLVEVGEYEQAGVVAAFSTEELAKEYAANQEGSVLEPLEVLERAPRPVTHYRRQGLLGEVWSHWQPIDGGSEDKRQWASDDNYCPHDRESRVVRWRGQHDVNGPILVEVDGSDQGAVDLEYERLMGEVRAGRIVPETQS